MVVCLLLHRNFILSASSFFNLQEELVHLKLLWDMASFILHTFHSWCSMPWSNIDVAGFIEECKQLTKNLKGLTKAVRNIMFISPRMIVNMDSTEYCPAIVSGTRL